MEEECYFGHLFFLRGYEAKLLGGVFLLFPFVPLLAMMMEKYSRKQ